MGRPSSYSADLCEQAHNYCLLGATNDELAAVLFDVSAAHHRPTRIAESHPDFGDSRPQDGRVVADARVGGARPLCPRRRLPIAPSRAWSMAAGELRPVTSVDPAIRPNAQACIFWLRNRRRKQWRERIEHEHTISDERLRELEEAGKKARDAYRR